MNDNGSSREDQRPGFTFWPGDWLAAEDVRSVSYAARGLWFDMLCLMARSAKLGMLLQQNGSNGDSKWLSNLRGGSVEEVDALLVELEREGVFSRENGAIICRRMRRPALLSEKRAAAGRLGVEAKRKQKSESASTKTQATAGKEQDGRDGDGKDQSSLFVDVSSETAVMERPEKIDPDFDAFWKAYPKKKAKDDAKKAWKRVKGRVSLAAILKAIADQKATIEWQKESGQYIPLPASWLNAGRWSDEVKVDVPGESSVIDYSRF
ncbi:MAG: hypothetical protein IMZ62_06920 [Chloroflexi bacterium]|nr:hypothetical protein [Chloroflexota bacterium]